MVEWAFTQVWAPPRSGRSGFNGPARPARVSENLALYLLPRLAGYFSWAELAPSLITSYCCREGLLHHELFLFFFLHLRHFTVNLTRRCFSVSGAVDEEVKSERCSIPPADKTRLHCSDPFLLKLFNKSRAKCVTCMLISAL